jgi:hypothetical protein
MRGAGVASAMRFLFLCAIVAAPAGAQVITGSVRGPGGPVADAGVSIQYFPTARCKDLGAMTTDQSAAEKAEFARCMRRLPTVKTNAKGQFEAKGLTPGWYGLTFRWRLAQKPVSNPPFGRYDGYVVMHTVGSNPADYYVLALLQAPFELKAGGRVDKSFVYRP